MEEMSDEDWLKWTSENVPTVKYKLRRPKSCHVQAYHRSGDPVDP